MLTVSDVCRFIDQIAPRELAEDWDNVGLLVGNPGKPLQAVMTCLTITPASAQEAAEQHADLVVTHHPLPFRPLKRITTETTPGRLLLQLIEAGTSIYSAHTAFDSTSPGINEWLSEILGIADARPLVLHDVENGRGAGRYGELFKPMDLGELVLRLKLALGQERIQLVGDVERTIRRAAVGCGSAGQFIDQAVAIGCDLFVTGEASFHTCVEAQAREIAMILVGHYSSERFGVERLAGIIANGFPMLNVWASRREGDPLKWL